MLSAEGFSTARGAQDFPAKVVCSTGHDDQVSEVYSTRTILDVWLCELNLSSWKLHCRAAAATEEALQTPHGDKLINLMLPEDKKQSAIDSCTETLECSDRNACDVELLIVGWVHCAATHCWPFSYMLSCFCLQGLLSFGGLPKRRRISVSSRKHAHDGNSNSHTCQHCIPGLHWHHKSLQWLTTLSRVSRPPLHFLM